MCISIRANNFKILQVRKFSHENNLPPKALLLIDNCTAHKPIDLLKTEDGNIIAMLFPPNVTPVLQPMDQNPIRLVKLGYRNKLLCNMLAEENISIDRMLKLHTIRQAILMLKAAWDELLPSVLSNSWNKINKWDDDEYQDEDNIPLSALIALNSEYNNSINEVQVLLSKVSDNVEINIDDVEGWNEDQATEDVECELSSDSSDSDIEQSSPQEEVSYNLALQSINNLIKYFKNDVKEVEDLILKRTKLVAAYHNKSKKQTTLKSYFTTPNT